MHFVVLEGSKPLAVAEDVVQQHDQDAEQLGADDGARRPTPELAEILSTEQV